VGAASGGTWRALPAPIAARGRIGGAAGGRGSAIGGGLVCCAATITCGPAAVYAGATPGLAAPRTSSSRGDVPGVRFAGPASTRVVSLAGGASCTGRIASQIASAPSAAAMVPTGVSRRVMRDASGTDALGAAEAATGCSGGATCAAPPDGANTEVRVPVLEGG